MADAAATVKVTGSSGAGVATLLTPVDLRGATSVAEVAVAASFACLRTKAGVVSCWGNTPGSASSIPTPTPVTLPGPALQIALGTSHACAIVQVSQLNNPLFCWGSNVF